MRFSCDTCKRKVDKVIEVLTICEGTILRVVRCQGCVNAFLEIMAGREACARN